MSRSQDYERAKRAERQGRDTALGDKGRRSCTPCPYQPESARPMAFSWIYGYTLIRPYKGPEVQAGKQKFG